jgi:hypothetical protein
MNLQRWNLGQRGLLNGKSALVSGQAAETEGCDAIIKAARDGPEAATDMP